MTKEIKLYQEDIPPDEESIIEQLIQVFYKRYEENNPLTQHQFVRGTHAKAHGCVYGEFIVAPDLAPEYRFGIFKEKKTYPCILRFSSGSPFSQSDKIKDIRAVAIKLLHVEGDKIIDEWKDFKTQDFILQNDPVFFIRNAKDFLNFMRCRNNLSQFIFPSLNPFTWHLREPYLFMRSAKKKVSNPIHTPYWSQTPYLLGPRAIKFSIRHSGLPQDSFVFSPSEHSLREALVSYLKNSEATLDFLIQFQTDPYLMPIEDATVEWSEKLSPYVKVASINIPSQRLDTPERWQFQENLSFNPWHSLPDHKPLGGINRARCRVYQAIAKIRHERMHATEYEPENLP